MKSDCPRNACQRPWHPVPEFTAPTAAIIAAVSDVWRQADARAAEVGAECRACGSCCDFPRRGHVLFGAGLEMDVLAAWAAANRSLDGDQAASALGSLRCPFWRQGRCSVRPVRLLGCRVYFCDNRAAQWLHEVCEDGLRQLDALCAQHGRPRWYGPALEYLERNMSHLICSARLDKGDVST